MNKFNDWLALKLSNGLSSMYFFYICVALDLAELKPVIDARSTITWVTYISQAVIQLIALPVLGASQKLAADHTIHHLKEHIDKKHDILHKHLGIK